MIWAYNYLNRCASKNVVADLYSYFVTRLVFSSLLGRNQLPIVSGQLSTAAERSSSPPSVFISLLRGLCGDWGLRLSPCCPNPAADGFIRPYSEQRLLVRRVGLRELVTEQYR